MRIVTKTAIALLAVALAAPAFAADDSSFLFPTFSGTVGSFFATTNAKVRFEGNTNIQGTDIDLEKDLGLDNSGNMLRLELGWRPFERHEFTLGYFDQSRSASRSIGRDIEFGGVTFPLSASVKASSKLKFFDAIYTYWAMRDQRFGWGLSIGAADITAEAELKARIGAAQTEVSRRASTDIPVPLIGTELRYAFLPNLVGGGRVAFLPKMTIGDYSGSVTAYDIRLEWEMVKHLGIGASWGGYLIDYDVNKKSWNGSLKYTLQGAQAYLRFRM